MADAVHIGKVNFVDANGLDDCIADVQLQSDAAWLWFHDERKLVKR
jgi:hypothetical protein